MTTAAWLWAAVSAAGLVLTAYAAARAVRGRPLPATSLLTGLTLAMWIGGLVLALGYAHASQATRGAWLLAAALVGALGYTGLAHATGNRGATRFGAAVSLLFAALLASQLLLGVDPVGALLGLDR